MAKIAIVSVARSFEEGMDLYELAKVSAGNWAVTETAAAGTSILLVCSDSAIIAGFRVHGVSLAQETYTKSNGKEARRVVFQLGNPIPVTRELVEASKTSATYNGFKMAYNLRRGIVFADNRTLSEKMYAGLTGIGFESIYSDAESTLYRAELAGSVGLYIEVNETEVKYAVATVEEIIGVGAEGIPTELITEEGVKAQKYVSVSGLLSGVLMLWESAAG